MKIKQLKWSKLWGSAGAEAHICCFGEIELTFEVTFIEGAWHVILSDLSGMGQPDNTLRILSTKEEAKQFAQRYFEDIIKESFIED